MIRCGARHVHVSLLILAQLEVLNEGGGGGMASGAAPQQRRSTPVGSGEQVPGSSAVGGTRKAVSGVSDTLVVALCIIIVLGLIWWVFPARAQWGCVSG